jgi:hypothetical protein
MFQVLHPTEVLTKVCRFLDLKLDATMTVVKKVKQKYFIC